MRIKHNKKHCILPKKNQNIIGRSQNLLTSSGVQNREEQPETRTRKPL